MIDRLFLEEFLHTRILNESHKKSGGQLRGKMKFLTSIFKQFEANWENLMLILQVKIIFVSQKSIRCSKIEIKNQKNSTQFDGNFKIKL